MNESSKTNAIRGSHFAKQYLNGNVLDIGAGNDPVCSHAVVFDQQHGDANRIDEYFEAEIFDTVHSSHCLEHMDHPESAILKWWSLVKPGGYMITVVPHEDFYEQGIWPSFFNDDHKSSFRLDKVKPLSSMSFDVRQLHILLPHSQLISAEIQAHYLDKNLLMQPGLKPRRLRHPLKLVMSILKRVTSPESKLRYVFVKWLVSKGYPYDQTTGAALAQIQVIVQKS
jgi:2-polyprenyl-3-methyl-5-hydroxy-6-metoxy-1,4-benzoquinol methylase